MQWILVKRHRIVSVINPHVTFVIFGALNTTVFTAEA